MNIEDEDLSGKIILEVGSGRGDTTRKLVDLLSQKPDTQLMVTDISDRYFSQLQNEFQSKPVQLQFICTGGHELSGIPDGMVDYLVCNYTLCAINSQAGVVALALRRFWEVLKVEGKLFVEEEFPISQQDTLPQEVWAEKWRILKSSMILARQPLFNEMSPELLKSLCDMVGFEKLEWTAHSELLTDIETLDFFQKRLDSLLKGVTNENLRAGFSDMAVDLRKKAMRAGGMEIPFYRLVAQKTAG
jgi:ubiquinone/menaquinone biosynthesis C-methylase UbiE